MKRLFIIVPVLSFMALGCNSKSSIEPTTDSTTATASSTAPKTDNLEKNKETALANVQYVSSHDVNGVFKDVTPDLVDYGDGSGPPTKGLDSCKASLQGFLSAFPDVKGENLMAIAEGNHVAVFGDWSGTFKGAMMGMKPTGKSFKVKDVDLFTFNDQGKITEHRSVQSFVTYMTQVGASMKK